MNQENGYSLFTPFYVSSIPNKIIAYIHMDRVVKLNLPFRSRRAT